MQERARSAGRGITINTTSSEVGPGRCRAVILFAPDAWVSAEKRNHISVSLCVYQRILWLQSDFCSCQAKTLLASAQRVDDLWSLLTRSRTPSIMHLRP